MSPSSWYCCPNFIAEGLSWERAASKWQSRAHTRQHWGSPSESEQDPGAQLSWAPGKLLWTKQADFLELLSLVQKVEMDPIHIHMITNYNKYMKKMKQALRKRNRDRSCTDQAKQASVGSSI